MNNNDKISKGALNGSLLDDTGYAVQKQAVADDKTLSEGGVLSEIGRAAALAARNSAVGTYAQTKINNWEISQADLPEDPQFKTGLFDRIRTDLPDVTDTEQKLLMGSRNVHEYNFMVDAAKHRRTDQRLASQSGMATFGTLAIDVVPEILSSVGLSAALARVGSTVLRASLAVGGNAAMGVGFEAARQRMGLKETDGGEVAQAALLSGAVGGLFDSGLQYGKMASKARKIARDKVAELANGGKPVADVVADDVVKAADNAAQADTAVAPVADNVVADVTKAVDSPVLKDIVQEITETAPKQVEALDALLTASRQVVKEEAGPMQQAFLDFQEKAAAKEEAYWAKYQADSMAELNARLAKSAADREAAAAAKTQADQAAQAAEGARVDTVMKDLEVTPVKTAAEQAWDETMATKGPDLRVATAEEQAARTMTAGRLRLKVGDKHSKPIFESPVDRALATLGSKVADQSLALDALDTLKRAFPGEENDTLVSMAHDFVDTMLMPHLRTTNGAPNIGRWWDKLDAAKYRDGYEESVKALQEAVAPLAKPEAPITAELIARHVDDADGALLDASVTKANKFVTNQTMGSGFKFLQKSNKVLADTMNERIAAFTKETGTAPDLMTVRNWMAKEMYGRAVFDKQVAERAAASDVAPTGTKRRTKAAKQAGFIQLKMLYVLAGGTILTFAMTPDANAGSGSATSGALSAILTGGSLMIGGKSLMKVLASKGMLTKEVAKNLEKAKLMKRQGATPEFIEQATKFRQVEMGVKDGRAVNEWHYAMEPEKFPELADEASLTSENMDEVVSNAKGFTQDGQPVKVLLHYDEEKTISSVADLAKAPHIKAETEVFGKKVYVKTPDVVTADAAMVARDKSAVARGIGMMFMSNIVPRLGRKAMELAADQLYKSIKVEAQGRMDVSFQKNMAAWYEETGAKKPFAWWNTAVDQRAFGEAIAVAKEFPDTPGVTKAAKAAAADMAKLEAEMVGRLKNLVTEMQAKGVVFTENNALYRASQIDPQSSYVSRLVSKDKMNALEAKIGREGVVALIKEGFASANSAVPKDKLDDIAQSIYETFVRMHDNVGVYIPKDQSANFIAKLKAQGLDDATIDAVGHAFGIRESGKGPSVTKARRMDVNLQATKTFTVDGKRVTVSMADLYERDAMALFGRWSNSMAGLEAVGTAGAYHGINLTDESVWGMLTAKASAEGASAKNIQALNAYRNLMLGYGRDVEFFAQASATERTIRTMTTFWLGSNYALAQAGDVGGMGTRSLKNLFKGIKAAYELRAGIKNGTIGKAELASVAAWMNLGLDSVSASTANAADGVEMGATMAEKLTNMAMKLNGMHFVNNAVAAVRGMEVQDFLVRHALGEPVDEKMWKHYATFGLDKSVADELAPYVRKHMVVDPQTKVLQGIDKKGWQAEDLLSARRLEMVMQKAGNTANSQASGFGETAAFFRSTMAGRFLGQLQGTAMFTTQRTLGEVYNFDSYVMNAWLTSMAFSAGSYMARVGMRYAGDSEELEKRLSWEKIFLASVRNSSFAGVGPNVIDAMLHYSGLMPGGVFSGATNSGRNGGGELAVQAAVKTPLTAVAGLMGLAKFDQYNAYTQAEAMALQRTVAPLWFLQPLMTFATQDLATKNPTRPAEE